MQIQVIHNAFHQQKLVVHAARLYRGPRLQLNDEMLTGKSGCYQVVSDSGAPLEVCLKWRFPDPVPKVTVAGESVEIAHPLKWYVYAWCALPALLLFFGDTFGWKAHVLGGLLGLVGTYLNLRIMRSEEMALLRYWATILVLMGSYALYGLLLTALLVGQGQQ